MKRPVWHVSRQIQSRRGLVHVGVSNARGARPFQLPISPSRNGKLAMHGVSQGCRRFKGRTISTAVLSHCEVSRPRVPNILHATPPGIISLDYLGQTQLVQKDLLPSELCPDSC